MGRFVAARTCIPWLGALLLLALISCQGSNSAFSNPRPRSREAAGTNAGLPGDAARLSRASITSAGGELEYENCKLIIPRGALTETLFIEITLPKESPKDVLLQSAYQINPDGLELNKEALLTLTYNDEDLPSERMESDLVVVQSVNGVWLELDNSELDAHMNTVRVPIAYLGQYALRMRSYDPRSMNRAPEASFEFAEEPFEGMLKKTQEQAKADEEKNAAAAPAEGAGDTAPAEGAEAKPGEGAPAAGEGEAAPPAAPAGQAGTKGATAWVLERKLVGGPDGAQTAAAKPAGAAKEKSNAKSNSKSKGKSAANGKSDTKAGGKAPASGDDKAKSGTAKGESTAAGNVAEGSAKSSGETKAAGGDEAPAKPRIGDTVMYFDASASSDSDGKVVKYDWDFDSDGIFDYSSYASPYAKHTFRHNGDYTVVLKVTDNGRYAQSGYGTNIVRIRNPKAEPAALSANIAAYPPTGPCPLTVHYASTLTGGTAPYVYKWTFSDGSMSSKGDAATTYPRVGDHTIKFSGTDVGGEELKGSLFVRVCGAGTPATPQPRMTVDISPTLARGQAPLTAKFKLSYEDGTGPLTYRVTFGDEGPGKDAFTTRSNAFEHVYPSAGFYLVKVVATDTNLRTATTFATVHAYTPEQARDFTPSAKGVGSDPYSFGHDMRIGFDYTQASARTVKFQPLSPPKALDQLGCNWDFGDGTYSTERKPSHTYAKDGVYEIRLAASDGVQRWRHRIWLPVSGKQPAAAIQRPPYIEGPAPLRLNFDAIVTRGEEPLRYEWSFGNARRSDPSTFYVFQLPGQYNVSLNVFDRDNTAMHAPTIEVRVRSGGASYQMPLAVVEQVSGSTRAAVIDYNSAFPLPLTSPQVEGPVSLVAISPDGTRVAMAGKEGLIVKLVSNAQPVVAFLPADGDVVALAALNLDAAYCTVEQPAGPRTYLLRPGKDPLCAGNGYLISAAEDGSAILLKPTLKAEAEQLSLVSVDVTAGVAGTPQEFAKAFEAKLTRDGRAAYFIGADGRLVKRTLASGKDNYLSGGDDRKSGLTIAADGGACAFVSQLGERRDVIYGRFTNSGDFRLASVTDQTKFFSEHLRLSSNGKYLMAYGAQEELIALLKGKGSALGEDEIAGEAAPAKGKGNKEPVKRKHLGIIRLDLSGSPDQWTITKVNPRFIAEAGAQFDYAGPF